MSRKLTDLKSEYRQGLFMSISTFFTVLLPFFDYKRWIAGIYGVTLCKTEKFSGGSVVCPAVLLQKCRVISSCFLSKVMVI